MDLPKKLLTATAVITIAILSGCASSPKLPHESFGNILVLAVADDYNGRAQYERSVVSGLRKLGVSATAYHQAVGGKGQVSRDRTLELIAEHGFDAVLVTQVRDSLGSVDVSQDSAGTKVSRKSDRPLDFFRYDYEELDEPGEMNVLAEATLDSDLHRASDSEIVWRYRWASKGAENVGILIDQSSAAVVSRLGRDKILGD